MIQLLNILLQYYQDIIQHNTINQKYLFSHGMSNKLYGQECEYKSKTEG